MSNDTSSGSNSKETGSGISTQHTEPFTVEQLGERTTSCPPSNDTHPVLIKRCTCVRDKPDASARATSRRTPSAVSSNRRLSLVNSSPLSPDSFMVQTYVFSLPKRSLTFLHCLEDPIFKNLSFQLPFQHGVFLKFAF